MWNGSVLVAAAESDFRSIDQICAFVRVGISFAKISYAFANQSIGSNWQVRDDTRWKPT